MVEERKLFTYEEIQERCDIDNCEHAVTPISKSMGATWYCTAKPEDCPKWSKAPPEGFLESLRPELNKVKGDVNLLIQVVAMRLCPHDMRMRDQAEYTCSPAARIGTTCVQCWYAALRSSSE